jgi:hypothetical protein
VLFRSDGPEPPAVPDDLDALTDHVDIAEEARERAVPRGAVLGERTIPAAIVTDRSGVDELLKAEAAERLAALDLLGRLAGPAAETLWQEEPLTLSQAARMRALQLLAESFPGAALTDLLDPARWVVTGDAA